MGLLDTETLESPCRNTSNWTWYRDKCLYPIYKVVTIKNI